MSIDDTTSDFHRRAERTAKPVRLWNIFVWLLLATVVIALLIGAFTYIIRGQFAFWELEPPLTAEELRQIVQSAVTGAAALGLGVTLYLSFRKQRTADDNYASTPELVRLQQDQHLSEGITRLRDRYVSAADQLGSDSRPIRLAGIYALASLADDWNAFKDFKERQVCIDLLTSYLALGERDGDSSVSRGPEWETIWNCIFQRAEFPNTRRDWAGALVRIRNIRLKSQQLESLVFDFGSLDFSNSPIKQMVFNRCHFESSKVRFDVAEADSHLQFRNCRFSGGSLDLELNSVSDGKDVEWAVFFYNCDFEGTEITLNGISTKGSTSFAFCNFSSDAAPLIGKPHIGSLMLDRCRFSMDPLAPLDKKTIGRTLILHEEYEESTIPNLAESYNTSGWEG